MQKTRFVFLSAVASLSAAALCGCQMFQRSKAWEVATTADIPGLGEWRQSDEYARELQQRLAANGVPSKLVKFRYAVNSRGEEDRWITQSVVIYQDETTPKNPAWLMDNLRSAPTWLPNAPVEKQIQFARREDWFEIVAVRELNGEHSGNSNERASHDWVQLFRRVHGTSYDSASPVDRRKMAALKAGR